MEQKPQAPAEQYVLSKQLVDGITNYLSSKPYREVTALLQQLGSEVYPQLKKSNDEKKEA